MTKLRASTRLQAGLYRDLVRPVLFRLHGGDPERVHETMISTLALVPPSRSSQVSSPVTVAGVRFPNRVGLAAGLDKDGKAAAAWTRFGFGFAELGTVTGHAQPGNPSPRLFRLPSSGAIINRMGFNNDGAAALAARLESRGVRRGNNALGIPLGISIGKTKAVPLGNAQDDYLVSLGQLARYADYIAVNVSSPNTPGLRALQAAEEIASLVAALVQEASNLDARPVPIFVKLAPDLEVAALAETLAVIEQAGAAGIIATNTTLRRDGLHPDDLSRADEAGGLSGAPLTRRALDFVSEVCRRTSLPVMGAGGIMSPADAGRMFDAGAQLIQIYTGFIYHGPGLVRGIHEIGAS